MVHIKLFDIFLVSSNTSLCSYFSSRPMQLQVAKMLESAHLDWWKILKYIDKIRMNKQTVSNKM